MKFSMIAAACLTVLTSSVFVSAHQTSSFSQLRGATERRLTSNTCTTVTFFTHRTDATSQSNGTFLLLGAGPNGEDIEVPDSCKNALDAQCDVQVCPADGVLRILATSSDAWQFSIEGVTQLVSYTTSKAACSSHELKGHQGTGVFPQFTWMDTDQLDFYQEYLVRPFEQNCHFVTFTTDDVPNSSSNGKFTIVGYGDVPSRCKNALGASCTLEVCPPDGTLRIVSDSTDGWRFTVSGVTELLNYATAPSTCSTSAEKGHQGSGVAPDYTFMDKDQFDFYQQYSF